MTTSDTPSQGIGLSEAANQLGALLSGEPAGKQTPKPNSEENAPADDAEALEATASEDETPEDDEAPVAHDDEGDEASEDGPDDDEAPADEEGEVEDEAEAEQLYTVKIDGKEEQVPLKELINGYQRQADYTRKTMAVREKENYLAAEYQQVQQERAQYTQLLDALSTQLSSEVANEPDWDALYEENPLEYVRQKDLFREKQEQLAAAQFEQQRVLSLQMQEEVARLSTQVNEGRAKLHELIPAWKDENRWKADRQKIREYGRKMGFADAELDRAYDHRAVMLLYKSMRYDELRAQRPQPQRRPAPAIGRPSAPQTSMRKATEVTRDKQRLAKTGNVKDAAKLFERII